jgi:uncharacterized protein YcfJ
MKTATLGLAIGIGVGATVLASAYMMSDKGTDSAGKQEVAQKCWDETITVNREGKDNQVAGTMIGGAIGGLAGNQIGEGDGKTAATAAGAVAGALIGKNQGKPKTYQETRVVRRCK